MSCLEHILMTIQLLLLLLQTKNRFITKYIKQYIEFHDLLHISDFSYL